MKQVFLVLFILAIGFRSSYSQDSAGNIESFRLKVLPQYNTYFSTAGLTVGGQLELTAGERYGSLSGEGRATAMDNLVKSWQESLILVRYGTKTDLWGRNRETGRALLIDRWDMDQKPIPDKPVSPRSKIAQHPMFAYIGVQQQGDSHKNLNIGLNARFGFFMLRDRWDLAASLSGFAFGNLETESQTLQANIGLSSKVYFPIKQYRISPNIGGELAWSNYTVEETSTTSISPFLLAGISWYVGNGSFDLGVRAGKQTMALIGYTFFPKLKSLK
jgi:hypothetical protein